MKANKIRELVKIVEDSNISELDFSRWGQRIRIVKNSLNSNGASSVQQVILEKQVTSASDQIHAAPVLTPATPEPEKGIEPSPETAEKETNIEEICSPMVGTFYRAPAPDAAPYVKEGDRIEPGKVLCVVEAMKLMNEIEAEISGTIVKILIDNSKPVEYNQPLFKIALD